jgi:hypothetical protein
MTGNRKGGIRPAASLLKKLVSPAFRRQGFSEADIITRWSTIVGPMLAEHSLPERLRFHADGGTLVITVNGAFALEMQHLQPVIMERINGYFGYNAVTRLSFRQVPFSALESVRRPRPEPSAEALAEAGREIAPGTPPALADALARLGGHVLGEGRGTGNRG